MRQFTDKTFQQRPIAWQDKFHANISRVIRIWLSEHRPYHYQYQYKFASTYREYVHGSDKDHPMPRMHIEMASFSNATIPATLSVGPTTVPITDVLVRSKGSVRCLNAAHVVTLAESIGALGLLEPILLDRSGYMLAGGHRLAALQLWSISDPKQRSAALTARIRLPHPVPQSLVRQVENLARRIGGISGATFFSRYPNLAIPVMVVDVDSSETPSSSLLIEVAENSARRKYTTEEMKALANRLIEAGYLPHTGGGRLKSGQLSLLSALQAAIGISKRHIMRLINPPHLDPAVTALDKRILSLARQLKRIHDSGPDMPPAHRHALLPVCEALTTTIESLGYGFTRRLSPLQFAEVGELSKTVLPASSTKTPVHSSQAASR